MNRTGPRRGFSLLGIAGISLAGACALFLAPVPAQAQITGCSVSSSGIMFSDYDIVSQSLVDTTGIVDVTCTGSGSGANNVVTLDLSAGGSGSCATRTMANGGNTLNYNVYTASNHAVVWCTPPGQTHEFIFGASPQTHPFTIYGRVAAGQSVPGGTYTDSLNASVSWPGGSGTPGTVAMTQNAPVMCSLSGGSLDFGAYTGASTTASASLGITCSLTAGYTISLNGGSSLSGTRRMAGPSGAFLGYDLYTDAGYTTVWGDGAHGVTVGGTGTGGAQSLTVYGRTVAGQLPVPGAYSDTVVVTVTY